MTTATSSSWNISTPSNITASPTWPSSAEHEGEEAQNEEELGLVILKTVLENGEEILSTLDSDEEIDAVYNEFMKELFSEDEEE